MNLIVNLGIPTKCLYGVIQALLSSPSAKKLKISGAEISFDKTLQITSPVYGAGQTLDCLEELHLGGGINSGDQMILVGSMGSISATGIALDDIVAPETVSCAYYGFSKKRLKPDQE